MKQPWLYASGEDNSEAFPVLLEGDTGPPVFRKLTTTITADLNTV